MKENVHGCVSEHVYGMDSKACWVRLTLEQLVPIMFFFFFNFFGNVIITIMDPYGTVVINGKVEGSSVTLCSALNCSFIRRDLQHGRLCSWALSLHTKTLLLLLSLFPLLLSSRLVWFFLCCIGRYGWYVYIFSYTTVCAYVHFNFDLMIAIVRQKLISVWCRRIF